MTENNRGQGLPQKATDPSIILPNGDYHMLVIGINDYPHVRNLNNARRDAETVKEVLVNKYQFKPGNIVELYDEQAKINNIYEHLGSLAQQIKSNDSLLLYFAGHGEYNENWNQGFWVPYEGKAEQWDTLIPFSFFKTQVEAIKSFHTLVIADSCYAGALFNYRDIRGSDEALERLDRLPSRYLLTSGRNEIVPDGPFGQHSPFADRLLWHLRQNPDELMSVADLTRDLVKEVAVGNNPIPRGEVLPMEGHRGGEFVFRKKGYELPPDAALPPRKQYAFRKIEASTDPMIEVAPIAAEPLPEKFASLKAIKKALFTLISSSDFEGTFELFNQVVDMDSRLFNSLILQQARMAENKRMAAENRAQPTDLQITRNQVRHALLEYIKELELDDIDETMVSNA